MLRIANIFLLTILFSSCINTTKNDADNKTGTTTIQHTPSRPAITPTNTGYRLLTAKDSIKHIIKYLPDNALPIILAVNRTDSAHISELKSILIPDKLSASANQYSPFPAKVSYLKDVRKIIFFSYPAQYFGAYEYGQLVYTGQTNMGREKDPTPTGLFYTNWKAEETHSTFNDEWELKWNFNIENKEGIGFHQYALPGYPASHSCLRLTSNDAQDLYNWADEWILKNKNDVAVPGTPVIIFGSYPFGGPKPWLQLVNNPHALDMTESELQNEVQPHMDELLKAQQKRSDKAGKQANAS